MLKIRLKRSFSFSGRTSFGAFLDRGVDKTVRKIEKRIADFTHIPVGMLFLSLPLLQTC